MKATIQQIESRATPLRATLIVSSGLYFYAHYEFEARCKCCGERHEIMVVQVMSVN